MDSHMITGMGELPKVTLSARDGARVEAYLHGGQVTGWLPAGGEEQLFLSSKSEFSPKAAIRGGVPIIFPQFGTLGALPKHGFARTLAWELVGSQVQPQSAKATFELRSSRATRLLWPHDFLAELAAAVGGPRLELALSITNLDREPFEFAAALHTYLRVEDIHKTTVSGLKGLSYLDSTAGGAAAIQQESQLSFVGEVDRIYINTPGQLEVCSPGRKVTVESNGFADTVVWNPGPDRGAELADLESDGFMRFVCVEAAAVNLPVHLAPGQTWHGAQVLLAEAER